MRSAGNNRLGWVASICLVIVLVGLIIGPVAGDRLSGQPDGQLSERQGAPVTGVLDSVQQNGTIAMEHVQVAVRASETQVNPGEQVTISYDGVAYTSNPEPIRLQLIALVPSGVTVSNMKAEGCNPQCPITDDELQPGDRLSPGSFTITPQDLGDHSIQLRAIYTFANGSTNNWNAMTVLTISVKESVTPTPEPGAGEKIENLLDNSNSGFIITLLGVCLFTIMSASILYSQSNVIKVKPEEKEKKTNIENIVLSGVTILILIGMISYIIPEVSEIGRVFTLVVALISYLFWELIFVLERNYDVVYNFKNLRYWVSLMKYIAVVLIIVGALSIVFAKYGLGYNKYIIFLSFFNTNGLLMSKIFGSSLFFQCGYYLDEKSIALQNSVIKFVSVATGYLVMYVVYIRL